MDAPDSIVQAVIDKHAARAAHGRRKYGVTMDRGDLTVLQWLDHLQEECMDAAVYLERLRREIKAVLDCGDDCTHHKQLCARMNRSAKVEGEMIAAAKRGQPIDTDTVRAWALRLGTPEA